LKDSDATRTWAGEKVLPHPSARREVYEPPLAFGTGASDAVKEARLAIPTPMLDVIFKDGSIASFNYSYLRRVDFKPGDSVFLTFADATVVAIEGRNLRRIRDQIRLHRADEIQEGRESEEELKADNEPHIRCISIDAEEELP
jgi:hypothetical protein